MAGVFLVFSHKLNLLSKASLNLLRDKGHHEIARSCFRYFARYLNSLQSITTKFLSLFYRYSMPNNVLRKLVSKSISH